MKRSATVEGRDKQDVVLRLDLIGFLALKFPIGVVNQHENAGPAVRVQISMSVVYIAAGKGIR